ncbi:hypothetical protein [Ferruginibacter sp.]|uniref:hypothetical protein n=1 Tax=Ferruginibacter sp. TaxID=1940288 RepID=UPI0026594CE8|nr:hypothetical protein [Ferruginibacter sp.]
MMNHIDDRVIYQPDRQNLLACEPGQIEKSNRAFCWALVYKKEQMKMIAAIFLFRMIVIQLEKLTARKK